jgi:hypothetical protein
MRYELTSDKVDCVVFSSKDYEPFLPYVTKISERFATYYQYIISAYGKDIEPDVPTIEESIETLKKLALLVGSKRIAWRYVPIFLTESYTIKRHLDIFEQISCQVEGYVDRCILGYLENPQKVMRYMPEIQLMDEEQKAALSKGFGSIAAKYGIKIQSCSAKGDYSVYGIESSGCMTLPMLGAANSIHFKNRKHQGYREGCQNIESRDIGTYHTCLDGCKYSEDARNPEKVLFNYKQHDPDSPLLIGELKETDTIIQGIQKSFKSFLA